MPAQALSVVQSRPLRLALKQLTPKRQAFVREYIQSLNATAAYQKVYGVENPDTAAQAGSRLLGIVKVQEAVTEAFEQMTARAEAAADEIVQEIDRLALSDPADIWDMESGELRLKPMKDWPLSARRAIAAIKVKRYPNSEDAALDYEILEIKLWDKNAALEKAGKYRGLFQKDKAPPAGPTVIVLGM